MPDDYDEEDTTITYGDLLEFEQGYADAMIGHFSNREDAADWVGIDGKSLATETLEAIRNDCRHFVINMIDALVDENGSMEVIDELCDYDAGRLFFLERMEVGIGFGDMASVEDDVRQHLIDAAEIFKPFELDIGEDRLVRIVIGPLSYRSLNQVQKGFADALVELEAQNHNDKDREDFEDGDGGEPERLWDGVTVHDLSQRALRTIVEGCEEFLAVVGSHHDQWRDFIADVPDYDIGWYLCLQRQRAGVGFASVLGNSDLTDLMVNAAEALGEMVVEVRDDGQIHIHNHRGRAATPAV
ncbi:MAG: hypothetical protein J0I99_15245 [Devosia sp.]|uniref:hypothetical protein n=1 Tax=Devosia sp. TaxID=1871048 RepID=UPI001AD5C8D8|nr:hypothetical protein [Devosia sp.]MBN9317097.1 hypothetical protein [Devosia sp.]